MKTQGCNRNICLVFTDEFSFDECKVLVYCYTSCYTFLSSWTLMKEKVQRSESQIAFGISIRWSNNKLGPTFFLKLYSNKRNLYGARVFLSFLFTLMLPVFSTKQSFSFRECFSSYNNKKHKHKINLVTTRICRSLTSYLVLTK